LISFLFILKNIGLGEFHFLFILSFE